MSLDNNNNNNDYASTLETYKSGTPSPAVNSGDFTGGDFGLTPQQEADYNTYQEQFKPVTQPLSSHDYYPNLGDPIGVGQSSGRIIGSQTQYVPNGALVPFAMWDARDAAIQKAAIAKAKDVEDWKARNMAKAPTSDLTSINDALRENFFKHQQESWESALRKTGGDSSKAAFLLQNDQNYQAKNKAFYDQAKLGTTAFNHLEEVHKRQAKGEIITEPLRQMEMALKRTQDPSTPEFKSSANIIQTMGPVTDMNDVFNQAIDKMKMAKDANAGLFDEGDYIVQRENSEEYWSDSAKQRIKETIYNHYGLGPNGESTGGIEDPYFNKSKIDSFVELATKDKIQNKKISLNFKPGERGGLDEMITEDNIASEPSIRNVENQVKAGRGTEGENKDYNNEQVVGYNGQTLKKPFKIDVAAGTQIYDLSGGNKNFINTKLKGVKKMEVAGSEIVDVVDAPGTTENGRVVTEQYRKRNPNTKTKKVAMAIVSYEGEPNKVKSVNGLVDERDEKGNLVTKKVSAYVPLKSIRNGVEKRVNGVYKGGLNVDLSLKAEEDYNSGKLKSKDFEVVKTGEGRKTVAVEKGDKNKSTISIGYKEGGYEYIGGDPNKQSSWKKI